MFCLYRHCHPDGALVQHRHVFSELEHLAAAHRPRVRSRPGLELWLERARSRAPRGEQRSRQPSAGSALLTGLRVKACRWEMGSTLLMPTLPCPVGPNGCSTASIMRRSGINAAATLAPSRTPRNPALDRGAPSKTGLSVVFPLLVKNKPVASRKLKACGVIATELWNEGDPTRQRLKGRSKVPEAACAELPIHQDVDEAQIRYRPGTCWRRTSPWRRPRRGAGQAVDEFGLRHRQLFHVRGGTMSQQAPSLESDRKSSADSTMNELQVDVESNLRMHAYHEAIGNLPQQHGPRP